MIKNIFFIILYLSLLQCKNGKDDKSIDDLKIEYEAKKLTDSLLKEVVKESLLDTAGLYAAPINVLSARLVNRDYSNYRDISVTYKNISNKKVEAIRFRWYGLNSFGEPADMGSYGLSEGFGSGFDDDPINPGKSRTNSWSILSKDAKKVILAWPYEVAFADGTSWKLKK